MRVLGEFNTTLKVALTEIDPKWETYDALIIAGSHSPHDIEEKLEAIEDARKTGKPFLGICHGHQLAAIEHAKNVFGIHHATSAEWSKSGYFIVVPREGLEVGHVDGQTYWSNYEVDKVFQVAWDKDKSDNFVTVPFHPEYESSKENPHPVLLNFIKLCRN